MENWQYYFSPTERRKQDLGLISGIYLFFSLSRQHSDTLSLFISAKLYSNSVYNILLMVHTMKLFYSRNIMCSLYINDELLEGEIWRHIRNRKGIQ